MGHWHILDGDDWRSFNLGLIHLVIKSIVQNVQGFQDASMATNPKHAKLPQDSLIDMAWAIEGDFSHQMIILCMQH